MLHHKVKSGETLYSIATTYKTTVDALKRTNRNVATLRPGMILIVEPSQQGFKTVSIGPSPGGPFPGRIFFLRSRLC